MPPAGLRSLRSTWARSLVLTLAIALIATLPGTAAGVDDGLPIFSGSEWTDLARIGLSRLPNLAGPGAPGIITDDESLDDRIWDIAFARGYEMRPTASGSLVVQDGLSMQPLTADAWEGLQAAAAAAGHQLTLHSAYRSVNSQRAIFNSKLSGTTDLAINEVLDYSSPPGASRHHSGYALDIKVVGGTIGTFKSTPAFTWISADNYRNAKRFGFIPSYPPDAPNQGPKPEPWEYLYVGVENLRDNDEMFFYRDDGLFRFYDVRPDGSLPAPLLAGDGYTSGWSAITAVDLDGDGQDEMFFYRDDGLFRYYDIGPDGGLGSPVLAGSGYTSGWSAITAVDLDGDGQDEMFFYREDGLFRYYDIGPDGGLGSPVLAGSGYTTGWTTISALDLDGGGQDEMFFYRDDGLFRYYDIRTDGSLSSPIQSGDGYTAGWDVAVAVNLGS